MPNKWEQREINDKRLNELGEEKEGGEDAPTEEREIAITVL